MMIVIEVVDSLAVLECHIVDITNPSRPFEVIIGRPDVFILEPTLLDESSSQLRITTLNDEYFLVESDPIFPLPSLHVHNFLFLFQLFLIDLIIFVIMYFLLLLFFAWTIWSYLTLGLVLQTSELLISNIVKFDPAFIFSLSLLIFLQLFLYFIGFEWWCWRIVFSFKIIHVIFSFS